MDLGIFDVGAGNLGLHRYDMRTLWRTGAHAILYMCSSTDPSSFNVVESEVHIFPVDMWIVK